MYRISNRSSLTYATGGLTTESNDHSMLPLSMFIDVNMKLNTCYATQLITSDTSNVQSSLLYYQKPILFQKFEMSL